MKHLVALALTLAASSAMAHEDIHGLIHDHAAGLMFMAVWLAAGIVVYLVDRKPS